MNSKRFELVLIRRLDLVRETLMQKGREYSSETDRLHNFQAAGQIAGCSPEKALFGMMLKHEVSVRDMVNDLDVGVPINPKVKDEKLGDWINYLILLDALLEERISNASDAQALRVETPAHPPS